LQIAVLDEKRLPFHRGKTPGIQLRTLHIYEKVFSFLSPFRQNWIVTERKKSSVPSPKKVKQV